LFVEGPHHRAKANQTHTEPAGPFRVKSSLNRLTPRASRQTISPSMTREKMAERVGSKLFRGIQKWKLLISRAALVAGTTAAAQDSPSGFFLPSSHDR
jgi:hypothetical protein